MACSGVDNTITDYSKTEIAFADFDRVLFAVDGRFEPRPVDGSLARDRAPWCLTAHDCARVRRLLSLRRRSLTVLYSRSSNSRRDSHANRTHWSLQFALCEWKNPPADQHGSTTLILTPLVF